MKAITPGAIRSRRLYDSERAAADAEIEAEIEARTSLKKFAVS
jgi:hypothetical protein